MKFEALEDRHLLAASQIVFDAPAVDEFGLPVNRACPEIVRDVRSMGDYTGDGIDDLISITPYCTTNTGKIEQAKIYIFDVAAGEAVDGVLARPVLERSVGFPFVDDGVSRLWVFPAGEKDGRFTLGSEWNIHNGFEGFDRSTYRLADSPTGSSEFIFVSDESVERWVDDFADFNGDGIEDHASYDGFTLINITYGQGPVANEFIGWIDADANLVLQNTTEQSIDVVDVTIEGENVSLRDDSTFDAVLSDTGAQVSARQSGTSHTTDGSGFEIGIDIGCNADREIDVRVGDANGNTYSIKVPVYDRDHGDLDNNGTVDFTDFLIMSQNFGARDVGYTGGDIDGNGKVEFPDFLVLSTSFGKTSDC